MPATWPTSPSSRPPPSRSSTAASISAAPARIAVPLEVGRTRPDVAMDAPRPPAPARGIYCNRTLNLRAIRAIGYDMDYTLVHYRVEVWERRAYEYLRDKLAALGWPVAA